MTRRGNRTGSGSAVSRVLARLCDDPDAARRELLPMVYDELRAIAAYRMKRLPPGQTLQPTALVHEAYEVLLADGVRFNGRAHFFGAAARAMRNLLVDAARRKAALKRGGDRGRADVELDGIAQNVALPVEDLLGLDEALKQLESEHPRKARVVDLRYFASLTTTEIAAVLDVTERTVERDWRFAKAWLAARLTEG